MRRQISRKYDILTVTAADEEGNVETLSRTSTSLRAKITNARRNSPGVVTPNGGFTVGDLTVDKLVVRPTSPIAEARFFVDSTVRTNPVAGTSALDMTTFGYLTVDTTYTEPANIDSIRVQFAVPASATDAPENIALYRWTGSSWTSVKTTVVRTRGGQHVLSAQATGIGPFAFGVPVADLSITSTSVASSSVTQGDSVSVSASVENTGGSPGTQTVKLTVDGETVATKQVSVPADKTKTVTFDVTLDEPGKYTVAVNDASVGSVVVESASKDESGDTTMSDSSQQSDESRTDTDSSSGSIPGFGLTVTIFALLAGLFTVRWRT